MNHLKTRFVLLLALGIFFLCIQGIVLYRRGMEDMNHTTRIQDELKVSGVGRTIATLESQYPKMVADYTEKLLRKADMSVSVLASQITEEGYTGRRLFRNAMVVELEGDNFIYPEGADNPGMRVPVSYASQSRAVIPASDIPSPEGESDYFYVIQMITPRYYYIYWTPEEDWEKFFLTSLNETEVLSGMVEASGGSMIVLDGMKASDDFKVLPGDFTQYETAEQMGFTQQLLDQKEGNIVIDNVEYHYVCGNMMGMERKCIFLSPVETTFRRSFYAGIVICLSGLIFILGILVYNYSVLRMVKKHVLSNVQKRLYCPERIRKVNLGVCAIGILFVLVTAVSVRLAGRLYVKTAEDRSILKILSRQLEAEEKRRQAVMQVEKNWYADICESLSEMLAGHPESMSKEVLAKVSDILGTQYIMLYDKNGKQAACSTGYQGFSLGTSKSDSTYDFRRLLLGVGPITHDACLDERTGLNSIQIGTPLRQVEGSDYGACILAIDPEKMILKMSDGEIDTFLRYFESPGKMFIGINQETGIIQYSTNDALIEEGTSAEEAGIPKEKIRGGLMDYFRIEGNPYFITTMEQNGIVYGYLTMNLFSGNKLMIYLLISILGFGIVFLLISLLSLRGFTRSWFEKWADKGDQGIEGMMSEIIFVGGIQKRSIDPSRRWKLLPDAWRVMLPGERTKLAIEGLVSVALIILLLMMELNGNFAEESLERFLFEGDWTRGYNSFAAVGIVTVILIAGISLILLRLFFSMMCVVFGTKGETICRLLFNLSEYAAIIIVMYYAFGFLGYDTRGLLASVGLISLAVSLGSRDLVADILAGISIVFEGEFQVGDIIEINGFRGMVEEIGVRSTKLEGRGGNIRIISNQHVQNVINMTRLNSWYPVDITISSDQPLEPVEELLERELPEIGKRIEKIVSGPFYKGVVSFGNGQLTLSVIAECREKDYHYIQRNLNREIYLLLTKNGIKL